MERSTNLVERSTNLVERSTKLVDRSTRWSGFLDIAKNSWSTLEKFYLLFSDTKLDASAVSRGLGAQPPEARAFILLFRV